MDYFEHQNSIRSRMDAEKTRKAFKKLAGSVSNSENFFFSNADDFESIDSAVKHCLQYYGADSVQVPKAVTDPQERLEYLCKPSGTMHRIVHLDERWYKNAFGAMVGQLNTGVVIALLPRGFGGYDYTDPETGKRIRITAKNASCISSEAILLYRSLPAKSLTTRDLIKFILRTLDKSDYFSVIATALAAALAGLLPAWANNIAFRTVVPSGNVNLILPIAALLFGVCVASLLISIYRNLVISKINMKVEVYMESAAYSRILMLPYGFFKDFESGELAMRVSQMSNLARTLITMGLSYGLTSFLSLVYLFQIGAYTPSLVLPAFLILSIQAIFNIAATTIATRFETEKYEISADVSGTVTSMLNGIQKIRIAGAEDRAFAKWADKYADYSRAAYSRPFLLQAMPACVSLIGLAGVVVLYYIAGKTGIDVAGYMTFSAAYGQISYAILSLSELVGQMIQVRPMLELITPILKAVPETDSNSINVNHLRGSVEVSGVSFRYQPDAPYVLNDLSLKIKSGEYVAIVGESGCGKSTLLRLLLGFEKAEKGSIFYDRYDIDKIDVRSLRRHIGTVMQNGKLFAGDIYSNITVAAPKATMDDAWKAAELAGIADDIRKMPMKMNTLISEGSGGISGGQKQRLMIARAICSNPSILIMDEATSALDNITQKQVSDALGTLDCTRIVVAHRLSTVRNCDRILMLKDGQIAEEGSYEELIAKKGAFEDLVSRQLLE